MKFIKTLLLALVVILATANFAFAQTLTELVIDSTETIIIKVKGADCSQDLIRMSSNIEKQDGVISSKIVKEGVTSKFEVKYKTALITKKEIYAVIENTSGCGNPDDRPYTVKNKDRKE